MRRRRVLCFVAALAAVPGAGAFGHEGGLPDAGLQDTNARSLNVLAFHPYPDPEGDPWGLPFAARNGTQLDYMRYTYRATLYPTAVFDGIDEMAGATQFLQTFHAYESAYLERAGEDAPLRMAVSVQRIAPMVLAQIQVDQKVEVDSRNMTLRLVVFEDDVIFKGGNGVERHRFTVRRILEPVPVAFDAQGRFNHAAGFPMDASWVEDRVGFVAYVVNHDSTSVSAEDGEVLQSASYVLRDGGVVIQSSRGVLLEFYTATWCPTCVWGDGAMDELANAYGVPSSRLLDRDFTYLRGLDVGRVALAAVAAAVVFAAALRVRTEPEDG